VDSSRAQHEETVVPIKPGLRAARPDVAATAAAAPEVRSRTPFWQYLAGGVLIAAAVFVFALFPRLVERSQARKPAATAAAPAPNAAPAAAPLSPEEAAALKSKAETLLNQLLAQQSQLQALHAESWGGEQYARYKELGNGGEDAFLANDFAQAVAKYTDATTTGAELLARSTDMVKRALAAGQEAFVAGNAELAIAQYDIVLGIEPGNEIAKAARARAERLPDVLALVARGNAERDAGDAQKAMATYREALAIDPRWEPASRALAAVTTGVRDSDFETAMSQGSKALAAQNYGEAQHMFRAALALRPQAREAQDGLTQADEGVKLGKIALTEARALAFERRELWDQAIAQYKGALADDPTLVFAKTGLERATARSGLDAKLRNLIDNPTLLFGDTVLADARRLASDARAVPEPGPVLSEQIDKLERLITLAATPIAVQLQSDQHTEVTVYRVGPIGSFSSKELQLRPGTYTAIGSRNGYRDVRQTFTVLPGRTLPPISVICSEPI
jgi:tetratricopeptide (TPR) repeat protein